MPLNMEKMMTTRGKKGDKDEEDCKLENEKKGKYKLLQKKAKNAVKETQAAEKN